MNDLNRLHYTILGDPADLAAVKLTLHAAPGAIGGTTPAAISGTTGTFTGSFLVNGANASVRGDSNVFMVQNTAATAVGEIGPVKAWDGSGSVTDLAIGALGANLKLYTNNSVTPTITLSSTGVAVTGTLSSSGTFSVNGGTGQVSAGTLAAGANLTLFAAGSLAATFISNTSATFVGSIITSTLVAGAGNNLTFGGGSSGSFIADGTSGDLYPSTDSSFKVGTSAKRVSQFTGGILDSGSGTLVLKGAGSTAVTITGANTVMGGTLQLNANNLLWNESAVRSWTFGVAASSGNLTLASGDTVGKLIITTAALQLSAATSKIIPGATSISHRNNADSADNLLIADNGDLTGRTKLTMPGPLTLSTAASKIVPGATSLSLRNNGDSADNILISDAGAVTMRGTLGVTGVATLTAQPILSSLTASRGIATDASKGLVSLDAPAQTFLGSDVLLNVTANYFNVVNTGSIGASGQVWLLIATATLDDTAGAAQMRVRIWDTSTVFTETVAIVPAAGSQTTVTLHAIVSPSAAATYHLSVKDNSATSGVARTTGNAGTANKATSITAIRLI